MKSSLHDQIRRAIQQTRSEHSHGTLCRVGSCLETFLQAEARGEHRIHPEVLIAGLRAEDQDAARECFDIIVALRALDG